MTDFARKTLIQAGLRQLIEERAREGGRMCYSVGCSKCGKTSWGGCGRHVPGVYNTIPDKENGLCLCKSWPGVDLPPHLAAQVQETATPSSCHVL